MFLKTLTPELAAGLALPRTLGVVIEDVTPGGPAERAGLRIGDIVETFAGRPIQDVPQFAKALFQVRVGESTAIAVLREQTALRQTSWWKIGAPIRKGLPIQ